MSYIVTAAGFRTGPSEAARVHNQILLKHAERPELSHKELAMVCFCGRNVVDRALQKDGQ